jgi:hypothetical protein
LTPHSTDSDYSSSGKEYKEDIEGDEDWEINPEDTYKAGKEGKSGSDQ